MNLISMYHIRSESIKKVKRKEALHVFTENPLLSPLDNGRCLFSGPLRYLLLIPSIVIMTPVTDTFPNIPCHIV